MAPLVDEETIDAFLSYPWYKFHSKREPYLQKLKELSNFSVVDESLNRFAHKAHYMALSDFLDRILKVLDAVQGQFSERVDNYKKKAVDPFKLEAELADKKTYIEQGSEFIPVLPHLIKVRAEADKYMNKSQYQTDYEKFHRIVIRVKP